MGLEFEFDAEHPADSTYSDSFEIRRPLIEGWTEYGCFDEDGERVAFEKHVREALSAD